MQLNPRYGDDPVIVLDSAPSAVAGPAIRQRQRLATALAGLSDEQWAQPSRCEGWSARDVIVHLESTNGFWGLSIASGVKGEPTTYLSTFDPVASPAETVDASSAEPGALLEAFTASSEALTDLWASLDDDDWSAPAEAPPGHVSVSAVTHHALWDSWVHERDVLLPLGIVPDVEHDEVAACLRYGAALGPGLGVNLGSTDRGSLGVGVTDPDLDLHVTIGDRVAVRDAGDGDAPSFTLTGDAVEVLEALSMRRPFGQAVPPDAEWMVGGLALQFDSV